MEDDAGGIDDVTLDVTVNNVAPTVDAGADQTVNEGETFFLDPATFSDPGYDCPACVPATEENFTFEIDWEDGNVDSGDATTEISGSAGVDTTGTVDGSHVYPDEDDGLFTVTVTVTDDDLGSDSDTIPITVLNVAPQILDVTATPTSVDEGSASTIVITADDVAADIPDLLYSFDCNDDTVFEIGPQASPSADCAFPDDSDHTVGVSVDDQDGGVTTDSVVVTVNNVAPEVTAAADDTAVEGIELTLDLASFTDPGLDDTHTSDVDWGDGTVEPGDVTQGSGTGDVSGTHIYADNGTYTVVVTVTDDDGGVGSGDLDIVVSNDPPSVTAADSQLVDSGLEVDLTGANPAATFTDRGFDCPTCDPATEENFTAEIDWGDLTVEAGPVVETPGSPGVLTTGEVTGAHTYAADGVYTVTVTVTDDDGDSDSASFTVIVGAAVEIHLEADTPGDLTPLVGGTSDFTLVLVPNGTTVNSADAVITIDITKMSLTAFPTGNPAGIPDVTVDCTTSEPDTIRCSASGDIPADVPFVWATLTLDADAIGPADLTSIEGTQANIGGSPVLADPATLPALEETVNIKGDVDVEVQVSLQFEPLPGDNIRFDVNLYAKEDFVAGIDDPWDIFDAIPLESFNDLEGTADITGKTFTLILPSVFTDEYDITIIAQRDGGLLDTLANLEDDFNINLPLGDRRV